MTDVAFGCEQLGGTDWGRVDRNAVRDAARCAFDLGVRIFDTADVYGLGQSEQELATALGQDRHRATIVTKGGVRWNPLDSEGCRAVTFRDSSARYLTVAIERSLARLKLDSIPIYLVHWPDASTPLEETIDCLERAQKAGLIRAYGLSNFSHDVISQLLVPQRISVLEGPLSLLDSDSLVGNYRRLRDSGLMTMTYGPLAQGLLSGRYSKRSVFHAGDRRSRLPQFAPGAWRAHDSLLRVLRSVACEVGRSSAQVAVRWLIDSAASSAVIVGSRSRQQVEDTMQAREWSLAPEQFERLSAVRRIAAPQLS